jgi:hypothetical protein
LARDETGGERRKQNKQKDAPSASPKKKRLQNRGKEKRKKSQFFFEAELQKSPEEKFPKKMKREGNENFKQKKGGETADDSAGDREMAAVFRVEKKKIVRENEDDYNCRGEQDAYLGFSESYAEIFDWLFEDIRGRGSRENCKKKKREPESFSIRRLGKKQTHQNNKHGAKTDQDIPAGEFFAIFSFDEIQSHNIFF